jgi:hypothetical protein
MEEVEDLIQEFREVREMLQEQPLIFLNLLMLYRYLII